MKLLIIDGAHHKNEKGLNMICNYLNIEYKYSRKYLKGYDYMYCPGRKVVNNIPTIYGPHFCVLPNEKLFSLDKGIYIQPSDWARDALKNERNKIPIYSFPFPVETEKFKPLEKDKDLVLLYTKTRCPQDINCMKNFLKNKNIEYKLFSYDNKYGEEDYLNSLQRAKYMVVVGRHESQGFAIEEALSCNVPLLVWDVKDMNQEYGINYPPLKATSIPYWDERCGEFFYEKENLEETFNKFINNLDTYKPRDYILENLSVEKCAERFKELLKLAS